jgi:hypothetical protein
MVKAIPMHDNPATVFVATRSAMPSIPASRTKIQTIINRIIFLLEVVDEDG